MARTPKPINWELVIKKMEAGCTAEEISADYDIHSTNFYIRFKEEFGDQFAVIAAHYRGIGKGNIRFTQYAKALGGSVPMLVLLGREWLGQDKITELKPTNDELLAMRHENMILRDELVKLREANANKSEAG
jgi:hypothetical protein